jgi:hypothetical protein
MSGSTAFHLLGTYRIRLRSMEKAPTRANPEVLEGVKRLVSGLASLPGDERIAMEIPPSWILFRVAATGALIAKFPFHVSAELGASPNCGPATPLGNSGVTGGPPSLTSPLGGGVGTRLMTTTNTKTRI